MAELVVALDVDTESEAVMLARSLRNTVGWLKIGLRQFIASGPDIVRRLAEFGYNIFLDLKFYDIPNTVADAVRAACALDIGLLTVHCQGGKRMCQAAVEARDAYAQNIRPMIFGVTVLTSFANGEMPGLEKPIQEHAFDLAGNACDWGLDGVVCSGYEALKIKRAFPQLRCLCPGIRPGGSANGDQRRVMTPSMAVEAGADFLVVGRPVILADNPVAVAEAIIAEMEVAATMPRPGMA